MASQFARAISLFATGNDYSTDADPKPRAKLLVQAPSPPHM